MGCNLSILGKMKDGEGEGVDKKILFLGLDNAGKTTLLFKMKDDEFKETVPTVGLNVEQIKYRSMTLTLWDVGGQARKLWKHYYDKVDGLIFVVDSTDSERLPIVKEELLKIFVEPGLEGVPILIMANKQDAEGASDPDEVWKELGAEDYTRDGITSHGCSAITGDGIWEGVAALANLMNT